MKKILLIVMAVIGFAGMNVAQDIYSSGYYVNSAGKKVAAVYRNGELLYEKVPDGNGYGFDNTAVNYYNGNVYWVRNRIDGDGSFNYGDVYKDNTLWLSNDLGSGSHIYDLYRFSTGNQSLWSVGCMTVNGVKTAARWMNDNASATQLGDGVHESVAFSAIGNYGNLYTCGYQYTNANDYHGVIWESTDVFYEFPTGTKIFGIAYFDGYFYTVGTVIEGGSTILRVWETDQEGGETSVVYSSLSSDSYADYPERMEIFVDETGDIYVVGVTSGYDRLYKNGEEIFNTAGYFTSVAVNCNGVYYTGSTDTNGGYAGTQYGRIWKDGSYLYSPTNCDRITNIFIEEPTCTNSEARNLPYYEGFETGDTDWPCWTTIDVDNDNGGSHFRPFWARRGNGAGDPYSGKYFVDHGWGVNAQEGWLISPKLHLQANHQATLTFQSNEIVDFYPDYRGVWVSTSGTNISDFVEVWSQTNPEEDWHEATVDLSDYQGVDIYIAFKYTETNGIGWWIDDIIVTEEAIPEYTLTVNAIPAEGGQVSVNPAGPYHYGDVVTLTATANTGYNFLSWGDGNTEATRTVTVTGNAVYNAIFSQGGTTMYTVNVLSENPSLGSVSGSGSFPSGAVIQISATPNSNARFVSWDDGNTDNPRSVTVTGDMTFVAKFAALQSYTITVESANPTMGSATGGGTFVEGTEITISATALTGYYFTGWDDGNADNPRTITVTQNATYRAMFSANAVTTYTVTVICNNSEGTVIGDGTYIAGATAILAAIPNSGYEFDKWNDNVTDNPRQVVVNSNMTFVAFFKGTGVDENEGRVVMLFPNPANDFIRLEGIEANSEVRIYNMTGALVKVVNANADEEISIGDLSNGLYLLRCGNVTLRFIKE